MDEQSTSHAAPEATPAVAPTAVPEAQMLNGVKVYPTSYIPVKAELHAPRPKLVEMEIHHIEAVHIAIFFLLTFILFIGMWKRPNLR